MHQIVKKLFASVFSLGFIAPIVAILFVIPGTVSASGNDCSVPLEAGFNSNFAEVVEVEENRWGWWGGSSGDDLRPLREDLYVEIDLARNYAQALRFELITGYSYTFCVEFNSDPDNPPTEDPKGDVYLFNSANWRRYQDEYYMSMEDFGPPEEVIDMIPVEWRDMVVFLPFRDTHAYEDKRSTSFSTAIDNDNKGFISWFGDNSDAEYFLALDNWNNSRPNDASAVDGDMIVQVWVEVEHRITLPKFTAYIIVGLLPLSCVIVPILIHSRYHANGTEERQEKQELVPLLEQ
ncbi:MAG: hypothetical protein VYC33_02225 [Candidatus Thermoplasmatota archaeon]|nr:hypothetical protein [Candidatus Thermoplasmatota archaeon]